MKFGGWILNNFWLKIISLVFAVVTWFYVVAMIQDAEGGKKTIFAKIVPSYNVMASKKLYVKAIFIGSLPDGYELKMDEVTIEPPFIVIAAPRQIINNIERLETLPINISRYKKTVIYEAQIAPIHESIDASKMTVVVTIPIGKIEQEAQGAENELEPQ